MMIKGSRACCLSRTSKFHISQSLTSADLSYETIPRAENGIQLCAEMPASRAVLGLITTQYFIYFIHNQRESSFCNSPPELSVSLCCCIEPRRRRGDQINRSQNHSRSYRTRQTPCPIPCALTREWPVKRRIMHSGFSTLLKSAPYRR